VVNVLSGLASVAAIVGVVIQFYQLRRDRRLQAMAMVPVTAAAPPTHAPAGHAPSMHIPPVPVHGVEPPTVPMRLRQGPGAPASAPAATPAPAGAPAPALIPPRRGGVLGPWIMGLWQLFNLCGGTAWIADPTNSGTSIKPEEIPQNMRAFVVTLAVNAAWAGLLARQHWPYRSRRKRTYAYLVMTALSATTCVVLLIVRASFIF
jgi:hypothetical protein